MTRTLVTDCSHGQRSFASSSKALPDLNVCVYAHTVLVARSVPRWLATTPREAGDFIRKQIGASSGNTAAIPAPSFSLPA